MLGVPRLVEQARLGERAEAIGRPQVRWILDQHELHRHRTWQSEKSSLTREGRGKLSPPPAILCQTGGRKAPQAQAAPLPAAL